MWNSKACNILKFIAWINLFIYLIAIMYCATVAILSEERYWTSLIIFILFVSTILQILILIILHNLSLDVYSHACSPSLQEPNGAPPEPHRSTTGAPPEPHRSPTGAPQDSAGASQSLPNYDSFFEMNASPPPYELVTKKSTCWIRRFQPIEPSPI